MTFDASSFPTPDFQTLFESVPGLYLVLAPDLTIVAVSDSYLRATMTRREAILGRGLFDVFPDNPEDPKATGTRNLRASLDRVLQNKVADVMEVQKYDIRRPEFEGGGFEERYWSPMNLPLLGANQEITHIIHRVEDVTEFVRLKLLGNEQKDSDSKAQDLHQRLRDANQELARREQDLAQVNKTLRDEIAARKRITEKLDQLNGFLSSIVENIPDMIFVKDAADLKFERFNRAGEFLLGQQRENLIGRNDYDFFPKEQADFFISKDREVLRERKLLDIPKEVIKTPHGDRILHTKKIPLMDDHGNPRYLLGISEDITERTRAEQELKALNEQLEQRVAERTAAAEERSRELAQSNAELERFAYVASHDLQEPLRMVASYVQLLERRYNNELDREAHEFIQFAVDGVNRMKALINDLLKYAGVGRRDIALKSTEVQVSLDQALSNLQVPLQECGARVAWDALPVVKADLTPLTELFQNLISNALKFHSDQSPQIHIGAHHAGSEWIFSVRDNGIGIDPKYAQRIFDVFQRLHTREEYPGNGIGLAICKRIVERLGGRIWVESQAGHGATFYFALPAGEGESWAIAS